jgi:phosphoribosylformimino-5-aminoimidazole carboxamide ribotide isomerase
MRVIPVMDLMGGQVVRGIAGKRSEYRAIQSQISADARPATVARALVDRFGFESVYVADLDAIQEGRYAIDRWQAVAAAGPKIWLDAGTGTVDAARAVLARVAEAKIPAELVVGLESLAAFEDLAEIGRLSPAEVIFSLDMRAGQPITQMPNAKSLSPLEIVERAWTAGARRLIVLDLADVGVAGGTRTLELCRAIRAKHPEVELIAGGGVRGRDDLRVLAAAGCDSILVATALHDGRLSREDVWSVR